MIGEGVPGAIVSDATHNKPPAADSHRIHAAYAAYSKLVQAIPHSDSMFSKSLL